MSTDLENRVIRIVASAIQIDPGTLNSDSSLGNVPGWDSLGHLSVISAIEADFGIELSVDDVIECESIADFVDVISEYISS